MFMYWFFFKFLSMIGIFALLSCTTTWSAYGHEHHSASAAPYQGIQKLEQYYKHLKQHQVRYGTPPQDAEFKQMGFEILKEIEKNELSELRKSLPPSLSKKVLHKIKEFLSHLNPIEVGKSIFSKVEMYGPWIGFAWGMGEVFEYLVTTGFAALAVDRPYLAIVPVAMQTHFMDLLVLEVAVGIPTAIRVAKTWARNGGFLNGPQNQMNHLISQGQKVFLHDEITPVHEKIQFKVRDSNPKKWLRAKSLRVLLDAENVVFEEKKTGIYLSDLEKIAQKNKVAFHFLTAFKSNAPVYASLLLREIEHQTPAAFSEIVEKQAEFNLANTKINFDLEDWILNKMNLEQSNIEGFTPDLFSRRLLYRYNAEFEKLEEQRKRFSKQMTLRQKWELGSWFSRFRKELRKNEKNSLLYIAETNPNNLSDLGLKQQWIAVFDRARRIEGIKIWIEEMILSNAEESVYCERVLISVSGTNR